jgi:hypothetical protein
MKAIKILAPAVALLVLAAISMPAMAGSEWVFFGYAKYAPTVDAVGSEMEVYGVLTTGSLPMPLNFDLDMYEYTLYVNDMIVSSYTYFPPPPFARKQIVFNGGVISIYADDRNAVGFTLHDYANLITFVDGELVLVANVDNGWQMNLSDPGFPPDGLFNGTSLGTCDFVGGSQLDALQTAEYYLDDWFFSGITIADPNPAQGVTVPGGFDRVFDAKIIPVNDPSATNTSTWGKLKEIYR